jgi:deoxyribonuclease-4
MVRAVDRAAAIGASALQVFSDNPSSWRRRAALPAELPAFRARLAEHDIAPLAIHAPYLINLASPEEPTFERSVAALANELRVAAAYGARFVNVHIGSHRGAGIEAGIARIAEGAARVLALVGGEAPGVVLVLENGSGGGFGMGSTVDEIARLDAALTGWAGIPRGRLGYCLDTAHAWGAGYAIDTPAGADELLDLLEAAVGLPRLWMVHMNDSRAALGSRADRHEHLGAGELGTAGLARLLTHPALGHVTYYLETPGMDEGFDAVNIGRARDIAAGRPLAPLPPEAFETASRKAHSAPPESDGGQRA